MTDVPPYRVPSMDEVRATPWNGLKVISTFSGCGGSSLGYRMAGCKVVGANEFVPAAFGVYRLNADATTVLWTDDVRKLTGARMLADVGLRRGELDILDGSPPCASFSTAGQRSDGWGEVRKYSDTTQRVDDLFYEYARLVDEIQPRAFVAENVEGLVKGVAKGYFKAIHRRLTDCGYRVSAAVLDASRLSVPQRRKRLFIVGVRNDLSAKDFVMPQPFSQQVSVKQTLGSFVKAVKLGGKALWFGTADASYSTIVASDGVTSPTAYLSAGGYIICDESPPTPTNDPERCPITFRRAVRWNAVGEDRFQIQRNDLLPYEMHDGLLQLRKFHLSELRSICSFPTDFQLLGSYAERWERLGRSVPPVMMKHLATAVAAHLGADQ